jgi:hypothetical protein
MVPQLKVATPLSSTLFLAMLVSVLWLLSQASSFCLCSLARSLFAVDLPLKETSWATDDK